MAGIAYGSGNAPNLPPVNLPTFDDGQQAPARIVIDVPSGAQATGNGGWAPYNAPSPVQAQGASGQTQQPQQPQAQPSQAQQAQPDQTGGWAPYQAPQQTPPQEVGTGEAAMRGVAHGLSFGFEPAIAGVASGISSVMNGGDFSSAYDQMRQQEQQAYEEAQKQHPYVTTAADIAGNLPTMLIPGIGMGKAAMTGAEMLPRIGQAIGTGAVAGGLFGAGAQTSQGGTPLDIAEGAGGGALAGAALGGVFGSGVEGATQVGNRVASIVRGKRDAGAEAARLVTGALKTDQKQVMGVAGDRAGLNSAQQAGTDVRLADFGGGTTKALLRTATNLSPEARDIVGETVYPRFEQQSGRVSRFIRRFVRNPQSNTQEPLATRLSGAFRNALNIRRSSAEDIAALQEAARRANRPAYTRAYEAGDRQVWSPELERLSGAPSIQRALRSAVTKWRDWQVHDGFGAANAPVMVENGILNLGNGRGLPVFPNIQFWDYAARHIADAAEQARRSGAMQEATRLGGLERQLKAELDRIVPEYGQARAGAARFFGAEDALDAGRMFARSKSSDIGAARQAIQQMTQPERELFARGYASEMADILERSGDEANVLKSSMLSSPTARLKTGLALGTKRATQVESILARARVFSAFDGAESAADAGRNFVTSNIDNREAAKLLAKMTADERSEFANSFADELANQIARIPDNRSVLNSMFLNNGPARQRILMALGQEDAGRLEALLRIEGIVDRTRRSLGNSTTMQQGADAGKFGGIVAGIEAFKGAFNPAYLIAIPLIWAGRQSAKQIDERVFTEVAKLLMSDDPAKLARGLNIAVKNPTIRTALRYASDLSARQLVNLLGPSGVGAATMTLGDHILGAAKDAHKDHPEDNYDNYQGQVAPP